MLFNPKVSILIPVYNGSKYVKEAIESALNQTYKNIEVIVINDGSNDNKQTENIIKSFGNKIKYIYKENGGVASALNLGIKNATGEYISWLSHDDIYLSNKVEKEIEILSKLKNKDTIIFSNFELINENGVTFSKTDFLKNIDKEQFCQSILPVIKGCVNGCTTLIQKQCFNEVGNFKEDLKTTNDYEMWIRLFNKYPSYFIEEQLIKYRIHKEQDTNKSPVYISESNDLWSEIINSLSEEKILNWKLDVFNIYMTLYIQMKNSKFMKAASIAYEKAEKIYLKSKHEVTIAMPCYNSAKYLSKAMESILEQTYCNYELIAVDDSSEDDTLRILQQYADKDFRIKIIKNEFKKGVSGAMNTAIKYATGKYFTRMDSDDISVLDRIEKQVSFLDKNKKYGVCSVNISMLDKLGNIYNESVYPNSTIPHEWTFLWTNPIPNAPCMYLTSIIKDNHILFSDLKTAEDYEFLSKVIFKAKVYMIPEALYYYRHNNNSLFNKNLQKTFDNSIEISKSYLKKITNKSAPEYYSNLTCFQFKNTHITSKDIEVVREYLLNLANKFKEYFNWEITEYKQVIDFSIPEILDRYTAIKEGKYIGEFEIKEKKLIINKIKRLIKKTIQYIKKYGIKNTMYKIIKKIKEKIWVKK